VPLAPVQVTVHSIGCFSVTLPTISEGFALKMRARDAGLLQRSKPAIYLRHCIEPVVSSTLHGWIQTRTSIVGPGFFSPVDNVP
jgi:hypothetical protein